MSGPYGEREFIRAELSRQKEPLDFEPCEQCEEMVEDNKALIAALRALQDPGGHIYHGPNGRCTGECRDIRAALAKATGVKR